jgi:hypothetical protein
VSDLAAGLFQCTVSVHPILSIVILCSEAGFHIAGAYETSADVPAHSFRGLEEAIHSVIETRLRAIPGLLPVNPDTDPLS